MKHLLTFLTLSFLPDLLYAQPGMQWSRTYGGNQTDVVSCIKQLNDGSFIMAGHSFSSTNDVLENKGAADAWMLRLTDQDNVVWKKVLGGSSYDAAFYVNTTLDGGFIVGARTTSLDGDVMGQHGTLGEYWLVKLSPEMVSTSLPVSTMSKPLEVFPNPVQDKIFLKGPDDCNTLNVRVCHISGQILLNQTIANGSFLDISILPQGPYLIWAETPLGPTTTRKFNKQD